MIFLAFVIISLFSLAGCSEKAKTVDIVNVVDVYVAGYEEFEDGSSAAVYWKNGERVVLSNLPGSAWATSITVNGSDVYIAGFETSGQNVLESVYWKNGE